jgi:hypothetical protein
MNRSIVKKVLSFVMVNIASAAIQSVVSDKIKNYLEARREERGEV